jgi:hypothetical protein
VGRKNHIARVKRRQSFFLNKALGSEKGLVEEIETSKKEIDAFTMESTPCSISEEKVRLDSQRMSSHG